MKSIHKVTPTPPPPPPPTNKHYLIIVDDECTAIYEFDTMEDLNADLYRLQKEVTDDEVDEEPVNYVIISGMLKQNIQVEIRKGMPIAPNCLMCDTKLTKDCRCKNDDCPVDNCEQYDERGLTAFGATIRDMVASIRKGSKHEDEKKKQQRRS